MKVAKSLQLLAAMKGCSIVPIRYHFQGTFKWGFDLVKVYDGVRYIQLQIEPTYYSNGDRWMISNKTVYPGLGYAKNMLWLACHYSNIVPKETGWTV